MGRAARPLHAAGNHRSIERGSDLQAARRGSLSRRPNSPESSKIDAALTPQLGARTGIASPPNPNGSMWSGFGPWTTRSKHRAGGSHRDRHARSHSKRRWILEGLGGNSKNGPRARRYRNGGNRGADEQAILDVGCP